MQLLCTYKGVINSMNQYYQRVHLTDFDVNMTGILAGLETNIVDDDQINLEPNSHLGMYLRRCLLAFNILSFEVSILLQVNFHKL